MANKLFRGDPVEGLPSAWDIIQVTSFGSPEPLPHPTVPNLGKGHVTTVAGVPTPTGSLPPVVGTAPTGASGTVALPRLVVDNGVVQSLANANFSTVTSSPYAVATTDDALWFNAISMAITATLPAAGGTGTQRFLFAGKSDSSANTVTIGTSGSDQILGASSLVFTCQWDSAMLVCDGSANWVVLSRFWGSQSAKSFFASPSGASGLPAWRAIVNADLPASGVTAGSYANATVTVNAQGIITAVSSGLYSANEDLDSQVGNATFVLASAPSPSAQLWIFADGELMIQGGSGRYGYTLSGNTGTWSNALPSTVKTLRAWYPHS
jgi:hypothetical protein